MQKKYPTKEILKDSFKYMYLDHRSMFRKKYKYGQHTTIKVKRELLIKLALIFEEQFEKLFGLELGYLKVELYQ